VVALLQAVGRGCGAGQAHGQDLPIDVGDIEAFGQVPRRERPEEAAARLIGMYMLSRHVGLDGQQVVR